MITFNGEETKIEAGDVILFRVNFAEGNVACRIQRGQRLAHWDVPGMPPLQLEGLVSGIMCPTELERCAVLLARVFGRCGAEKVALPDHLACAGWVGFQVM